MPLQTAPCRRSAFVLGELRVDVSGSAHHRPPVAVAQVAGGFFVAAFFWRPLSPRGRLTIVEPPGSCDNSSAAARLTIARRSSLQSWDRRVFCCTVDRAGKSIKSDTTGSRTLTYSFMSGSGVPDHCMARRFVARIGGFLCALLLAFVFFPR